MEEKKENELSAFKKKWKASRAAFEQILFEKEIGNKKYEKNYKGIIGYFILVFLGLSIVFFRYKVNGTVLSYDDLSNFDIVDNFIKSFSKGFIDFLFYGKLLDFNFEMPFYYLNFIPVFKFITSDKALALLIVNGFYYVMFTLSVYLMINIRGNYKAAWLGVSIAGFMPFLFELISHFSIPLATLTLVSWTYLCLIKSEELENPIWVFPMALCFALGLITDKYYIFYVLPILHWLQWGFAGIYRGKIFMALLLAILIGVPFYLRIILKFASFALLNLEVLKKSVNFNILTYMPDIMSSMNVLFFILGIITIIWLKFSLFDLYEKRKIVIKWFISILIVLWIFPFKSEKLIYPMLIPLAISIGIMTPVFLRKYIIAISVIWALITQFLIIPFANPQMRFSYLGIRGEDYKNEKIEEVITLIKENLKGENKTVAFIGNSKYINHRTLSELSAKYDLKQINFKKLPYSFLSMADMVIVKGKGENKKLPFYFNDFFNYLISFNDGDITIYIKKDFSDKLLRDNGFYNAENLYFGGYRLKNIGLYLNNFNQDKKVFEKAVIEMPSLSFENIDLYNMKLIFDNLGLVKIGDNTIFCGFSKLKIDRIKATDFSISRILEDKLKIEDFSFAMNEDIFDISGSINSHRIELKLYPYMDKGDIVFRIVYFNYDGLNIPQFIFNFLNFKIVKEDMSVPVEFKNIKVKNSIIEIT
jgi:hypothetical protein